MIENGTEIVVIDSDVVFRESTSSLFKSAGLPSRAQAHDDPFSDLPSTCVVVDLDAPRMTGMQILKRVREQHDHVPVIVVAENCDVSLAVDVMKSGATDVVDRSIGKDLLIQRVREAIASTAESRRRYTHVLETGRCLKLLTPREKQVMELVIDGLFNRQIGEQLGVTEKTVEVHRSRVMTKMKTKSIAELVGMVLRWRMHHQGKSFDDSVVSGQAEIVDLQFTS